MEGGALMQPLLLVEQLSKSYNHSKVAVAAVSDVSFIIKTGECLGLVGESGSGKSTIARLLLALEQPDSGDIKLEGRSIVTIGRKQLHAIRKSIQVVFQDPTAALNDRLPIWRSVIEPLDNYPEAAPPFIDRATLTRKETAARLLEMVGMKHEHLDRYPHELSGGQKQRVAIARGISLNPQLLICDEPTSSLDVSVQAQILQLLRELQEKLHMSFLFISHDIAAVHQMCKRIIVMKAGHIVDQFPSSEIWSTERHEYTRLLISALEETDE